MNLREALLKEHSKAQCEKIARYVGSDRERFATLMSLFLDSEYRITQRAAWPISYCIQQYPELAKPYLGQFIRLLHDEKAHNAVHRNIMRLLQNIEVPEKYAGELMDICFAFIESNEAAVAIKAFSLTVLEQLAKEYPDINNELKLLIESRWEHESAAFHSRARKILKRISK
jgi:hypothetical protein